MPAKELYALLAILLMVLSRGAYFLSIYRGRTKPHAFSWLIWSVISSIGFAAQVTEGAGPGAWVRGFGSFTCYVVMALGFWKGEKTISRSDWTTLAVAFAAIPLWVITKTPVYSVILVCLIDTSGYIPTVRKAWKKPQQETYVGYILSACGATFSLLAIENYNLSTYLYPAVLGITNLVMATYLLTRTHYLSKKPPAKTSDDTSSLHWQ